MGIFDNLFKQKVTSARMTTQEAWRYTQVGSNAYELDTIRSAIDALARNIGKMEVRHIRTTNGIKSVVDDSINRTLKKPNEYMTTYEFLYKVASTYYANDEAFIYPVWQGSMLMGLYPINATSYELLKSNGKYYVRFQIKYLREYTVPYEDLIHIRWHYYDDDILANGNNALRPAMELVNATNQGIIQGIKNSALIRGILRFTGVIKDSDLNKSRDKFIKDNFDTANNGGVLVTDSKASYDTINQTPYIVSSSIVDAAKAKIFDYFGVNQDFVQGSGNYEQVYETRMEPFAILLSQALTSKLFTDRELGTGNEIIASTNRMQYQTFAAINSLVTATIQQGIFTVNEIRAMYGYDPIPDGDQIKTSLNYTADGGTNDKE